MAMEWVNCRRCHGSRVEKVRKGGVVDVVPCKACKGTGGRMKKVRDAAPVPQRCKKCHGNGCKRCNGTGLK